MSGKETDMYQLLAQGGEADIYDYDEDNILRVLRRNEGKPFDTNQKLQSIFIENDIHVPLIREHLTIDDKPAVIMQKIKGPSFLDVIQRDVLHLNRYLKRFASMHAELLHIDGPDDLWTLDDFLTRSFQLVEQTNDLTKAEISTIEKLYHSMTKDIKICHGDFHPGNILVDSQTHAEYIIDWDAAHLGNPLSDIAHTYLLMTNVPRTPGQGKLAHMFLSICGKYMGKKYHKCMQKEMDFTDKEFEQWLLIMSLMRICHGLPSEKPARIRFIRKHLG